MQDSAFASRIPVILLMVGLFWVPALGADPPIVVEKVEVKGIWHHGAHNAFTDLIRWRDRFYCTFREGYQHVSYDGKIRVLVSEDGETWKPAALFVLPGYDLRDPELEITPDDRLMLLARWNPLGELLFQPPTSPDPDPSRQGLAQGPLASLEIPGRNRSA